MDTERKDEHLFGDRRSIVTDTNNLKNQDPKGIAYIPLTKGQLAIVDLDDVPMLLDYTWCCLYSSTRNNYTARIYVFSSNTSTYMHRLLLGAKKGEQVDHINVDPLDNRRCNLRICSSTENNRNRNKRRDNTSGYKGVSWHKGKWCAQTSYNEKQYYIGRFVDKEDAATAYNFVARELFGEFARYNEVPQPWLESLNAENKDD
jgi:hypothetical protein